MRIGTVFYTLGYGGFMVASLMIVPLLISIVTIDESQIRNFLVALVLTTFISGAMYLSGRSARHVAAREIELLLIMLLFFTLLPVVAAVPFYAAGQIDNFAAAYFEAVSAITTSGGTIITQPQLETAPIIAWRAILAWLGGLWTIIFGVAVLAPFTVGGLQLFGSPLLQYDQNDSLSMRLGQPLRRILPIYATLTLISIGAFIISGLPFFDAFCFALSAISTTGFVTHSDGVAGFAQMGGGGMSLSVLMVTCLVGALGAPHLVMLSQRKFFALARQVEIRTFIIILLMFIVASYVFIANNSLWLVMTQSISLATTAGFIILPDEGLAAWPIIWVLLPPLIGGMAISTAGGIKVVRIVVLSKAISRELTKLAYPSSIHPMTLQDHPLREKNLSAVWAFFAIFLLCVSVGLLALSWLGLDMPQAWAVTLGAVSNSLASSGGWAGFIGFGAMDTSLQLIIALLMIAGRLEFLVLMVIFTPSFWRSI